MAIVDSDHSSLVVAVAALNKVNTSLVLPTACNEPKNEGPDSGYASQSSTPDVSKKKRLFQPFRNPKQLRPCNKSISQLTWDRFSDLREQYAENLNQLTRSLPNCPSILMTLQVLGEDEVTAEPWVFVQCDKAVFKKVSNFFKQPMIKIDFEPPQPDDRSPRLRVLVCPLKPRQLAKDADLSSQHYPVTNGDLIEIFGDEAGISTGTLCGTQIMSGHSHEMRKSTMGGIIMVVDKKGEAKLFGMTAGHFLLQGSYYENEDEIIDDLDDGIDAEESYELDLSNIEADMENEDKTPPLTKVEENCDKKADLNKWSKVGKLSESSHIYLEDGRNLDWALITIDHDFVSLPNMSNAYVYRFYLYQFGECKFSESETNVIMMSARGLKWGSLSSYWSYMMLPPGKVLVRTWLLSFSDGNSK